MRTHSNKTRSPDFSPVGRNNYEICTVPTCHAVSSRKNNMIYVCYPQNLRQNVGKISNFSKSANICFKNSFLYSSLTNYIQHRFLALTLGYSDFPNLMGFTSKKMPNIL